MRKLEFTNTKLHSDISRLDAVGCLKKGAVAGK
jgi:hypothetical protein